jgi:hypothetical protein
VVAAFVVCAATLAAAGPASAASLRPAKPSPLRETVITDYADRVVAAGALTIPDTCATNQGTYGVNYGPNDQGGCIRHNLGPSAGRVPVLQRDDRRRRGPGLAPQRLR